MKKWTTENMPSQAGRCAVVTGTGGIGFEVALALAQAGCEVIIAGRNAGKGADAVEKIRQVVPFARVEFEIVDLASLSSITAFSKRVRSNRQSVDLLINNAAIMVPPQRNLSDDGFEMQFATNYLGHFALTGELLPLLRRSDCARVVTVSSVANREGRIDFSNLQGEKLYQPMAAYAQSKLACLMFAFELQRRSQAGNWGIASVAAHPGIARTELLHNAPGKNSVQSVIRSLLWFLFQPAAQGALPILFAATSPQARPGLYYGPDGFSETRGYPSLSRIPAAALNADVAARLWNVSEQMAGITFGALSQENLSKSMLFDTH